MSISIKQVSLDELVQTLESPTWASGPLYFVGDIGGTNARLGFGMTPTTNAASSSSSSSSSASHSQSPRVRIAYVHWEMSKKEITQLVEFFHRILDAIRRSNGGKAILSRIASGALSVPGPIADGGAEAGPFNNLKGMARLRDYPSPLFPQGRSMLLNDLQAGGYGLVAVSDAKVMEEYFTTLWEGDRGTADGAKHPAKTGAVLAPGDTFVAAPGTGLGTSLIHAVGQGKDKRLEVLPLELGSVTLPFRPGRDDYYIGLSAFIRGCKKAGAPLVGEIVGSDGSKEVNVRLPIAEDGCCTGGIVFAYYYLKHKADPASTPMPTSLQTAPLSVAKIVALAKEKKDPCATQALDIAYRCLMDTCSEAVMTFLPDTVVVIGDNMVRNGFYFEDPAHVEGLRRTVLSHPMQEKGFLSRTTFLRQTKSINLNLLGGYGYGTRTAAAATANTTTVKSKL